MRRVLLILAILLTTARNPAAIAAPSAPPQSGRVIDRIVARIEGQKEASETVGHERDTVSSASISVTLLYH